MRGNQAQIYSAEALIGPPGNTPKLPQNLNNYKRKKTTIVVTNYIFIFNQPRTIRKSNILFSYLRTLHQPFPESFSAYPRISRKNIVCVRMLKEKGKINNKMRKHTVLTH